MALRLSPAVVYAITYTWWAAGGRPVVWQVAVQLAASWLLVRAPLGSGLLTVGVWARKFPIMEGNPRDVRMAHGSAR